MMKVRWPWQAGKRRPAPDERNRTDELVREADRLNVTMRQLHENSRRLNRRQSALVEALRRANEAIGQLDGEAQASAPSLRLDALVWEGRYGFGAD